VGVRIVTPASSTFIQDLEITGWNHGVRIVDVDKNLVETSNIHTNTDTGVEATNGAQNIIRNSEIETNTSYGIDVIDEDQLLIDGNSLSGNGLAQIQVVGRSLVSIVRNQIEIASDGILIGNVPAEALVKIGGSATWPTPSLVPSALRTTMLSCFALLRTR